MSEFLTLSSIEKRRKYVRAFLNDLGECKIYPDESNASLLTLLLENHPEKEKKKGVGVSFFRISKNPLNKASYHIDIVRKDGTETGFSWRECCRLKNFKFNPKEKLLEAFRTSIENEIIEYKKNNPNQVCVNCNSRENIQLDHIFPFSKIVNGFICSKDSFDFPTQFNKDKYHKYCFLDCDEELKNDFVKYHNEKAEYQYLCRTCNIKKSNKL